MNNILYIILQLVLTIFTAPLVNGVIRKVKALSQKRKGSPLLQMYFDLYKLLKKTAVVSETSSWIFKAAPYFVFSTAAAAALLAPATTLLTPDGFAGDIILMVYLLALGRFFMTLASLDTGSTFGGMGSSREVMISSLMEPSILISVFTVGLIAGTTSVYGIMQEMNILAVPLAQPVIILVALAILIIIIAETSRIPVDDPATHLELTMVHEAMILEYSGRHLALMELGSSVKQLVFITLLANICVPTDQWITIAGMAGAAAVAVSLLIYQIKVIIVAVVIAIIEVSCVKFRFFSIPNLAALSFILAFIGFLQYFVLGR